MNNYRFVLSRSDKTFPNDVDESDNQPEEEATALKDYFGTRMDEQFFPIYSCLSNLKFVYKQLKKIIDSASGDLLSYEDLPVHYPGDVGSIDAGIILRNRFNHFNPSNFHMVLESADYSLRNKEWEKYFPGFQSGTQAHHELHILLTALHKIHLKKGNSESANFLPGQLVIVQYMKETGTISGTSSKGENGAFVNSYEMRRGIITAITMENNRDDCMYSVFLLDFGFSLKVSENHMCPLLRPFNTIAPLAIPCTLYGISPLGAKWSKQALQIVSDFLSKQQNVMFSIHVLANFKLMSQLVINVDLYETSEFEDLCETSESEDQKTFSTNLVQFIIENVKAAQWNLFPSQPQLSPGASLLPAPLPNPEVPRINFSFGDALLLALVHLFPFYKLLPIKVIRRDIKKLFRLRCNHLYGLVGATQYLAMQCEDAEEVIGNLVRLNNLVFPVKVMREKVTATMKLVDFPSTMNASNFESSIESTKVRTKGSLDDAESNFVPFVPIITTKSMKLMIQENHWKEEWKRLMKMTETRKYDIITIRQND